MIKPAIVFTNATKHNVHESISIISNSNIVPTTSFHNNSRLYLSAEEKRSKRSDIISFQGNIWNFGKEINCLSQSLETHEQS